MQWFLLTGSGFLSSVLCPLSSVLCPLSSVLCPLAPSGPINKVS